MPLVACSNALHCNISMPANPYGVGLLFIERLLLVKQQDLVWSRAVQFVSRYHSAFIASSTDPPLEPQHGKKAIIDSYLLDRDTVSQSLSFWHLNILTSTVLVLQVWSN